MKLIAFITLVATSLLSAQDPENKTDGIRLRAIAFSLFQNIDEMKIVSEEKELGILEIPTGQLRQGTGVRKRVFQLGIGEGENFRPLSNVILPEQGRDFILVMAPTATGYKAFPVRADDPDFKGDDTLLFNFTPYTLGAALGTAKQLVKSMQSGLLRPSFPPGATFYKAFFAYEKDGKYIPFNNTRWPVNGNTKALVFAYADPEKGRLSYRSVTLLAK